MPSTIGTVVKYQEEEENEDFMDSESMVCAIRDVQNVRGL